MWYYIGTNMMHHALRVTHRNSRGRDEAKFCKGAAKENTAVKKA